MISFHSSVPKKNRIGIPQLASQRNVQVLFLSQKQWEELDGKCGVCGDAFDGIRENEAGGIYATGTIGRNYTRGQVIKVKKTTQLPLSRFSCNENSLYRIE